MLPQNSWFRSATGRAGNADVVPGNGMVLGARLHQKAGLVQLRLREDGEVDGLRVDHSLGSEVVGGVAGVEASMLGAEVLQQQVLVVDQGLARVPAGVHRPPLLVPLDQGQGHAGGRGAGQDHIVAHIANYVIVGNLAPNLEENICILLQIHRRTLDDSVYLGWC